MTAGTCVPVSLENVSPVAFFKWPTKGSGSRMKKIKGVKYMVMETSLQGVSI